MTEREAIEITRRGIQILTQRAVDIAMLPLEDWLKAAIRAESFAGPGEQPKIKFLKSILVAAIPLKAAVLAAKNQGLLKESS